MADSDRPLPHTDITNKCRVLSTVNDEHQNVLIPELSSLKAEDVSSLAAYCEKLEKLEETFQSSVNKRETTTNDAEGFEKDYFSLWHKNHHGSVDLGLDEKNIQHGATPKLVIPQDSTFSSFSCNQNNEENVSSLVRDFLEKSTISGANQSVKGKESLLKNANSTQTTARSLHYPPVPPLDPTVIADLEDQAKSIATSMDTLIENLTGTLQSISALSVECVESYRDAVCKTCDAVDSNIKSMYQLMAKCEELSKSMKPVYKLNDRIKEIRRLLDLFEGAVYSGGT